MANNGIGWAVSMLRGGQRVRRSGWNGKGMWLAYVEGDGWGCSFSVHPMDGTDDSKIVQPSLPFVVMRTAPGHLVPWLCSQADLLANDWELIS